MVGLFFFFFQAEDGIRDLTVTGVRRVLFRSRGMAVGQRQGDAEGPGDGEVLCDRDRYRVREPCRAGARRMGLHGRLSAVALPARQSYLYDRRWLEPDPDAADRARARARRRVQLMAKLDDSGAQARVRGETLSIDWPMPGVALVTFERAAERNALSLAMLDELEQMLAIVSKARVAVLILTGSGPAFCAGADLKMLADR